jgi:hypothetical protein
MDHRTVELSSGQKVCGVEIVATRRLLHCDVELRGCNLIKLMTEWGWPRDSKQTLNTPAPGLSA